MVLFSVLGRSFVRSDEDYEEGLGWGAGEEEGRTSPVSGCQVDVADSVEGERRARGDGSGEG